MSSSFYNKINKFLQLKPFHIMFYISFFITLIISGYIFIDVLFLGNKESVGIFSTWQFPMLVAIFMEMTFYNPELRIVL